MSREIARNVLDGARKIEDPYGLIVCLAMDADGPDICPKDNPAYEPDDRITGICETCPYCRTLKEVCLKLEEKEKAHGKEGAGE